MNPFREIKLNGHEAALWLLGQAGCVIRANNIVAVIDPYLTDSVGEQSPAFRRLFKAPIEPEELEADLFIVTHDHADHLDPETFRRYRHKTTSDFIAPRLAAEKLKALGAPAERVHKVDAGEKLTLQGVEIRGAYAVPTGPDVLDTTGYVLTFPNGRSLYHASDTAYSALLLKAAPRAEVLLTPINGKWGNLSPEQAVELTSAVKPRYVIPNHYDLMALNSENPETFRWLCLDRKLTAECVIPKIMEPFIW